MGTLRSLQRSYCWCWVHLCPPHVAVESERTYHKVQADHVGAVLLDHIRQCAHHAQLVVAAERQHTVARVRRCVYRPAPAKRDSSLV